MGLQRAQGQPDYGSAGTIQYIPEVFAGQTLVKFQEKSILNEITNQDYKGDFNKKGDSVTIRTRGSIVVDDYIIGQDIVFTKPESASIQMLISRAKYFAVDATDVDLSMVDIPIMNEWQEDASYQMDRTTSTDILQNVYTDVSPYNQGLTAGKDSQAFNFGTPAAPLALTRATILQLIVDAGTALEELNVPKDNVNGWWMAFPPWAVGLIKTSDLMDASITGDSKSIIRSNGRLGMIDNFRIYSTNQLYHNGTAYWNCLFGSNKAISFATKLSEVKHVDFEKGFGQGLKGLNVYGFKVIQPTALGLIVGKR